MHVDGAFFRHKAYEKIRATMVRTRKKKYVQKIASAKRLIERGHMTRLQLSNQKDLRSEYNVFLKGFPRRDKLRRIMRFSRLIIFKMRG